MAHDVIEEHWTKKPNHSILSLYNVLCDWFVMCWFRLVHLACFIEALIFHTFIRELRFEFSGWNVIKLVFELLYQPGNGHESTQEKASKKRDVHR